MGKEKQLKEIRTFADVEGHMVIIGKGKDSAIHTVYVVSNVIAIVDERIDKFKVENEEATLKLNNLNMSDLITNDYMRYMEEREECCRIIHENSCKITELNELKGVGR